ncbi:DUF2917 domain-containing protein [Ampullimonas aquatilis]|uniref:DUF2917 domain-containing protein n=1 Tax=Ampullimonas aquatilis TaxID=1341549 RepID=UPI003C754BCC
MDKTISTVAAKQFCAAADDEGLCLLHNDWTTYTGSLINYRFGTHSSTGVLLVLSGLQENPMVTFLPEPVPRLPVSQLVYLQDQQCWTLQQVTAGWLMRIKARIQRHADALTGSGQADRVSQNRVRIQIIKGTVWLTQAWQETDHFLSEGSSLLCHAHDCVLLQALGDTVLAYQYQAENSACMTVSGSPNKPAIMAKTVSMASVACAK